MPVIPSASEEVVIVTGRIEAVIVIVNDLVAVSFGEEESWTLAVNVDEPAAEGTPEITPLVLKLSPAGNDPAEIVHK